MPVPHLCLDIHCRFLTAARLPLFKGSTLRGAFGHALKAVACALKRQDCEGCLLAKSCAYAVIFATERLEGGHVAARPHPYIINPPPTERQDYAEGEAFTFGLALLGPATGFLPHIVYAVEEMGKGGIGAGAKEGQGRFAVAAVRMADAPEAGPPLYDEREKILRPPAATPALALEHAETAARELAVELITPLRIKKDNHLLVRPAFADLARAALRRVSMLETHYGGGSPGLDFHGLLEQAEAVVTVSQNIRWLEHRRFSNRQKQDMLFGGLVGEMRFQGELAPFLPLLRYAERVNLGKQTAFGLGKIRVTAERMTKAGCKEIERIHPNANTQTPQRP